MCECVNVSMGSYDKVITVVAPNWSTKEISLDACISEEVQQLWGKGIQTTGCCCGHNLNCGYIGVIDADISRMLEMGYEIHPNETDSKRRDSFKPKS